MHGETGSRRKKENEEVKDATEVRWRSSVVPRSGPDGGQSAASNYIYEGGMAPNCMTQSLCTSCT